MFKLFDSWKVLKFKILKTVEKSINQFIISKINKFITKTDAPQHPKTTKKIYCSSVDLIEQNKNFLFYIRNYAHFISMGQFS